MYLVPLLLKSLALLTSRAEGVIHLLRDLKLTIGPLQCLPGQLGLLSTCIVAQQVEAGKIKMVSSETYMVSSVQMLYKSMQNKLGQRSEELGHPLKSRLYMYGAEMQV